MRTFSRLRVGWDRSSGLLEVARVLIWTGDNGVALVRVGFTLDAAEIVLDLRSPWLLVAWTSLRSDHSRRLRTILRSFCTYFIELIVAW